MRPQLQFDDATAESPAHAPGAAEAVPAVQLRGVSKRFAGRVVLDDIRLDVAEGEFFALVGPSGSGKSTLLKMVSGIETPDTGEVWLRGRDVTRVPPYRRDVHTVFQNYALFPHLDVEGNVAFPLRVAGVERAERRRRVAEALTWVHLEQFTRRRIDHLSGGERQRVAVARALVDGPACLLLDEPLAALDPHLRSSTLELLEEIQSRLRMTYVYVTHDRQEALRAADRIAVLRDGRLEQVGTPQELYQHPQSPFVASFLGPINWFEGEIAPEHPMALRLKSGARLPLGLNGGEASGRVLVGVRPEDVLLDGDEFLAAQVVHRDFCGASMTLRMKGDDRAVIIAELRNTAVPPPVGARVSLSWLPHRGHLFPLDQAGATVANERIRPTTERQRS